MSFLNSVRKWVYNIISYKNIESALDLELPDNSLMEQHMQKWLDYLLNEAPYLYDKNRKRKMKTMSIPSVVSKEYAKLCLLEYEGLVIGEETRAKWLQEQHDRLIKPQIKNIVQWSLALGNGILKPRMEKGKLQLDFVTYPNFIPMSWNNEGLNGVIIKNSLTKGKRIYTLLEVMEYKDGIFAVKYYTFVKETRYSTDDLGVPVSILEIPEWAGLIDYEYATDTPWFYHMKTPALNNLDPNSPLGVSILTNSTDVIRSIDENYSALQWEMIAGKVRTMIPKSMFSRDEDGNPIVPDPEDDYYMITESAPLPGEGDKPYQFAPPLRNENYIETIKFNLRMLESHLSFSEGTFSTEEARPGQMTATQIMADKQETYNAVMDTNDNMVKPAIRKIIDIFNDMADKLNIPDSGTGKYETSVEMNMNATIDQTVRFEQALELAGQGKLPWKYVLMYSQMQFTEKEINKILQEAEQEAPEPEPQEE